MYRSSWVALVAAMGALAPSYAFAQAAPPRLELQVGGGENASVSGGVFVPFMLPDGQVLFADGWLDYQDGGAVYGSIGGGYRQQVGDWVLGVNGALEFASSPYGFNYQQISAGIEALSTQFEFRLNGHAPIGTTSNEVDALSKAKISNGAFVINQGYEVALYGLEAEAGIRLPVFPEDSPNALKLYAGAYVQGSERTETVAGVSLRTELTLSLDQMMPGATLGLGGGMRYDSNNELSGSVHVRFSAPIGGAPTAAQAASPLYQRVERNRSIATTAGSFGSDVAAFADSGSGKVIQVSAADGKAKDLNAMIAAAGDGAIILASGKIVVDETLVLASNQMLVGGGGVVNLTTADGKKVGYLNTGAATTLDATPQSSPAAFAALAAPLKVDGIRLADGTTVSTVSIIGAENGIVAEGVKNITIDNVNISNINGNGIVLTSVKGASITNSSISDTALCTNNAVCEFAYSRPQNVPNAAVKALGVQDLSISNLSISDVEYGIFIGALYDRVGSSNVMREQSKDIALTDIHMTNSRREGLLMVSADKLDINGLVIDNSVLDRSMDLIVFQRTGNTTLKNATLIGGANSLMFVNASGLAGSTDNIQVSNVELRDPSRANIFINGGVSNVLFSNVQANGAGTYGAYIYGSEYVFLGGPVKDITFENFTVNNAKDGALYTSGPANNLHGDITYNGDKDRCVTGKWMPGVLTQAPGKTLSINGVALPTGSLATACRAE